VKGAAVEEAEQLAQVEARGHRRLQEVERQRVAEEGTAINPTSRLGRTLLGAALCGTLLSACTLKSEYYPLCNLRTCFDDPSRCGVKQEDLEAVRGLIGHGVHVVEPDILRHTDNFVLIQATDYEHEQLKQNWQSIACITDGNRVVSTDADRYWKCISSVPTWVRLTTSGELGKLFLDRNYRLACLRSTDLRQRKEQGPAAEPTK
jgi:hypothetical protein